MPFALFSNWGRPWLKLQRPLPETTEPKEESAEVTADAAEVEGEMVEEDSVAVEGEVAEEIEAEMNTITEVEVESEGAVEIDPPSAAEASIPVETTVGEQKVVIDHFTEGKNEVVEDIGTTAEALVTPIFEELSAEKEDVPDAGASVTPTEVVEQISEISFIEAENLSALEAKKDILVAAIDSPDAEIQKAPVESLKTAVESSVVSSESMEVPVYETVADTKKDTPLVLVTSPAKQDEVVESTSTPALDSGTGVVKSPSLTEVGVEIPGTTVQTFTVAPTEDYSEVNRILSKYGITLRREDKCDNENVTVKITTRTA